MEKIKALLYCTKNGKKLVDTSKYDFDFSNQKISCYTLNGKIVAECDFEVEEIECRTSIGINGIHDEYTTKSLGENELLYASKIDDITFINYLKGKNGYAIHIKNLKERVMELSDVYTYDNSYNNMFGWLAEENEKYIPLAKAPQNMCRVWIYENGKWVMYILISVRPEWLCLELYGEKTIEVRKRVLKGML